MSTPERATSVRLDLASRTKTRPPPNRNRPGAPQDRASRTIPLVVLDCRGTRRPSGRAPVVYAEVPESRRGSRIARPRRKNWRRCAPSLRFLPGGGTLRKQKEKAAEEARLRRNAPLRNPSSSAADHAAALVSRSDRRRSGRARRALPVDMNKLDTERIAATRSRSSASISRAASSTATRACARSGCCAPFRPAAVCPSPAFG